MALTDLSWVLEIERSSFLTPWSEASFRHELLDNPYSQLFAMKGTRVPGVVAYACVWIVDQELRINNIGVHPRLRLKGIGTRLVRFLLEYAARQGCVVVTLEVRPSNESAIRLYEKVGFRTIGRRRNYYLDTREDAVVMALAIGGRGRA
jgi:ribosomal-protein-alanine N-acetyltransferase